MEVYWTGPGIQRQLMPGSAFRLNNSAIAGVVVGSDCAVAGAFWLIPRKDAPVSRRAASKACVFLIKKVYVYLVLLFDYYDTKIGTLHYIDHCFMLGG